MIKRQKWMHEGLVVINRDVRGVSGEVKTLPPVGKMSNSEGELHSPVVVSDLPSKVK